MRTGPKGKSPQQKLASGFVRPSRGVVSLYPDHVNRLDPEVIPAPEDMTEAARVIWDKKVTRYRQRGQKVEGFEDDLQQYCELEAALNKGWRQKAVTMAMVNAHRIWAAEFFDTPASHRVRVSQQKPTTNSRTMAGARRHNTLKDLLRQPRVTRGCRHGSGHRL
jgi:hypothetical protein